MADAAVGFLLENLKQLLLYNAELIGEAKDQVEGLHKDLILFKAFLRDSTEKRRNNQTLQALVDNIRGVVDKAEDAIDKFVVQKTIHKARSALKKVIHAVDHSITIRNVAKDIESIRKEIKEIYDRQHFGFQALQLEDMSDRIVLEKKAPVVEEDNVVGFDDEAKTVIGRLTGGSEEMDIISIIGMPGLGKTTLARKIYNDPAIEYDFFTRVWVYVSQKYSRKEIFLSILSVFMQPMDAMSKMSDDKLAEELRKNLEKGKFLIVMDDVWTKEAWNDLKIALPKNNKHGRVLITSRHRDVALHANPTSLPHDLKFLTSDESWELLEKKVFGKEKCLSSELEILGKEIATECKGLPLAIVVIAGILLNNREISDWWRQVAENVSSFIVTDQSGFMDVVALSYNHLPYHLKSCFLYLGVFPEDYEIPVWILIRLWIAEGFIEQNGELSLEDIAEACLNELVNRNLVMAGRRRSTGQLRTCRVHDMLYDFCKREAKKQNFYQEIKSFDQVTLDTYRRLCIHSNVTNYISSNPSGKHVRSFLCFAPEEIILPLEHLSTIPKGFELLRVLDIRSIKLTRFPKDLLQLALLRYIALSSDFKTLPASISKLWNLQTLVIETSSRTLELREDFWKMYQFRHLHTNASAQLPRPPSSKQKGRENVQTLSTISPESCTEHVFARTPNIKKLGVRGNLAILLEGGSTLFDNLGKLQYLTNLKLFNDVFPRPLSEGKLLGLPPAYKFPTKLKKLTLSHTMLEWEYMSILGNLEKLEALKLKDNAFKGKWWEPKDGGFRSLKVLHIGRTDLVFWKASAHHFPSLRRLVLRHCDKLEAVPSSLADVPSFQVLELYRTSPQAAASARNIQLRKAPKECQDSKSSGGFKLSIYPPDLIAN